MKISEVFVLDTGPLFDHLALRYQEETGIDWLGSFVKYLTYPDSQGRFARFLEMSASRLLLTAGVVAEVQGHARRAEKKSSDRSAFREDFWRITRDELDRLGVEERRTAPLLDMRRDLLVELGPVDVGVLELAREVSGGHRPAVVVTGDGALLKACRRERVSVRWHTDVPEGDG